MKVLLFLLFLTTLVVVPCSADNITIELFQNSAGDYFVQYNDEMYACVDDECTFNISANVTQQDHNLSLSKKDMKRIAQYVALEVEFPEYSGGINETWMLTALDDEGEDICDNIRDHNLNTLAPTVDDFDLVEQEKIQLESEVKELSVKGKLYDEQQIKNDEIIEIYKKDAANAEFFGIMCAIGFAFVVITCTPGGKTSIEFALKKLKRE